MTSPLVLPVGLGAMREQVDQQAMHKACDALNSVVRQANQYIDEQAPWALKKTDVQRMRVVRGLLPLSLFIPISLYPSVCLPLSLSLARLPPPLCCPWATGTQKASTGPR